MQTSYSANVCLTRWIRLMDSGLMVHDGFLAHESYIAMAIQPNFFISFAFCIRNPCTLIRQNHDNHASWNIAWSFRCPLLSVSCQSCFWQTDEQYDAFRHQAHSTNAVEGCTLGHIYLLVENGSCSEHEFGSLNSANKASNLLEWPGWNSGRDEEFVFHPTTEAADAEERTQPKTMYSLAPHIQKT